MIDVSPKLAVRGGAGRYGLEGMLSFDWTPAQAKTDPVFGDVSYNRFRVLVGAQFRQAIAPRVRRSARLGVDVGVDVDIAHAGYTVDIPFVGTTSGSDTHTGFAFEGPQREHAERRDRLPLHEHRCRSARDGPL